MGGSRKHNVALFRAGPAPVGLVMLVCIGGLVLSCDQVERHRALAFFFDGVPPLGQQGLEKGLLDSDSQDVEPGGQKPTWYVHEPVKDCTNCHRWAKRGGFSTETHLIAPVPKLCYNCHPDFTASASFVHGPVAVGQCLLCHSDPPHKSKIEHLLKEPQPKLCFLCHDVGMIELIPAHLSQQTSACTDCHDPHAGPTKALLKGDPSQTKTEPADAQTAGAAGQDSNRLVTAPDAKVMSRPSEKTATAAIERQSLFDVFWEVTRLIEQGDLQKARAQLEALKNSGVLTDEERQKILNVLKLMDDVSAGRTQQPQKSGQNKPPNKPGAETSDDSAGKRRQEVAGLYYRSMAFYRDGQLARARGGFVQVLQSGLIPAPMEETIRNYISDIDKTVAKDKTLAEPKQ
jgi:predicted CXXCH cytochrome family protein